MVTGLGMDGCCLLAGEGGKCRRCHRLVLWCPFLCLCVHHLLHQAGVLRSSGWWLCL